MVQKNQKLKVNTKKKNFLAKSLRQKLFQQKVIPNKKTYTRKNHSTLIK